MMNPTRPTRFILPLLAAILLAGCQSDILPLRPLQHVKVWVPGTTAATEPAAPTGPLAQTQPFTPPATQPASSQPASAPATEMAEAAPATQPGHFITEVIDPNQTSRYIYKASYDNIWQQAMALLSRTGFVLDRRDYRLGVLTTLSLPSAQIIEPWKPQQTNPKNALENTINNQQRRVRITISNVPNKPDFYQIAVQVIVERQSNPTEAIGGPVFVTGSAFGRSTLSLQSDYIPSLQNAQPPVWYVVGHDPDMEKKLLNELFHHI